MKQEHPIYDNVRQTSAIVGNLRQPYDMKQEHFLSIIAFGKRRQSSALFGNLMILLLLLLLFIIVVKLMQTAPKS